MACPWVSTVQTKGSRSTYTHNKLLIPVYTYFFYNLHFFGNTLLPYRPGFSEAIHGRKHWVLYNEKPEFHKDQTSRNWMEYNYMSMINSNSGNDERPLECTLDPGDIIYFPDMWWHATINLDPYTAFVSTFTQEHLFVESSKTHGI